MFRPMMTKTKVPSLDKSTVKRKSSRLRREKARKEEIVESYLDIESEDLATSSHGSIEFSNTDDEDVFESNLEDLRRKKEEMQDTRNNRILSYEEKVINLDLVLTNLNLDLLNSSLGLDLVLTNLGNISENVPQDVSDECKSKEEKDMSDESNVPSVVSEDVILEGISEIQPVVEVSTIRVITITSGSTTLNIRQPYVITIDGGTPTLNVYSDDVSIIVHGGDPVINDHSTRRINMLLEGANTILNL
jgi:hypothetical protein